MCVIEAECEITLSVLKKSSLEATASVTVEPQSLLIEEAVLKAFMMVFQ